MLLASLNHYCHLLPLNDFFFFCFLCLLENFLGGRSERFSPTINMIDEQAIHRRIAFITPSRILPTAIQKRNIFERVCEISLVIIGVLTSPCANFLVRWSGCSDRWNGSARRVLREIGDWSLAFIGCNMSRCCWFYGMLCWHCSNFLCIRLVAFVWVNLHSLSIGSFDEVLVRGSR